MALLVWSRAVSIPTSGNRESILFYHFWSWNHEKESILYRRESISIATFLGIDPSIPGLEAQKGLKRRRVLPRAVVTRAVGHARERETNENRNSEPVTCRSLPLPPRSVRPPAPPSVVSCLSQILPEA